MTVAGGTPTLTLNDGGTATYTGGSGTEPDLQLHRGGRPEHVRSHGNCGQLNGATITDGGGNAANLSLSGLTQIGPQIDTRRQPHRGCRITSSGDLELAARPR